MSRALVEDQLSIDAAGIPHLNEESAFGATIRWGSGHSMELEFDPIHEQLMLRWRSEGTSCQQTIYLTTTGPNFGGKRRWFVCDQSGDRVRKLYWCPVQGRVGGGWYGRRAIGLTYYSQRLSDSDRSSCSYRACRRWGNSGMRDRRSCTPHPPPSRSPTHSPRMPSPKSYFATPLHFLT